MSIKKAEKYSSSVRMMVDASAATKAHFIPKAYTRLVKYSSGILFIVMLIPLKAFSVTFPYPTGNRVTDENFKIITSSPAFSGQLDMNSHKITELSNGTASSDAAAFGQIPVVATQANQETGTSNTVFVSPGVQQYHTSAAKAWVVFRGTGTVAALASYNVSSITDNGDGDYTVNFTTAFSSANFACACMARQNGAATAMSCNIDDSEEATVSTLRIETRKDNGVSIDSARVHVICFGDQ